MRTFEDSGTVYVCIEDLFEMHREFALEHSSYHSDDYAWWQLRSKLESILERKEVSE